MPEGDSIHSLASKLRALLVGRRVVHADARHPALATGLAGLDVSSADARGKHLLVGIGGDVVLRVHLGMDGAWHVQAPGARWRRPLDDWALTLRTGEHDHVLFRPRDLERLRPAELADHPVLARLGPDLCEARVDLDEVLRRAADPGYADWPVQDLLLCQQVAAGIGNVYKSEVLFLGRLDPSTPVRDVPPERLRGLYATAARLLRANVRPGRRNTTGMPHPNLWVYGARDRRCPRCRGALRHEDQGRDARVTWWCPRCQPPLDSGRSRP